jgi:(p)ppGpp synthase/HD superfamily hydrolase
MKMADRLHNMQTLQFLPQAKQLRMTREVLDTFLPVAQQLSMHTVRSELQALAFAALIRNQPSRPPRRRGIVALDIERSTSRSDPVKAELRTMLYELSMRRCARRESMRIAAKGSPTAAMACSHSLTRPTMR